MRAYRIYLIRHGLTQANFDGRYIGTTDLDLCEEGAAELLSLQEEYEYPGVGRVYASPLKRCVETARLLYPDLTPITVSQLREYSFGSFEGKTAQELKNNILFEKWLRSSEAAAEAGAEPVSAFEKRVVEGLDLVVRDMMKAQCSDAAVITHAGVIATLLARCGLPQRPVSDWQVGSGKGYTLLINASLWGNARLAEIFTPIPYGFDKEHVMLEYQRELDAESFKDGE